ncbi:hypothetical protein HPB48_009740 [Haemaphysalis longicornis]|uniref:Uncharacterized protein n=1 Tax=Haemaphysalis longicornis TaxID=44386 RepID=A0A9J6GQ91_HAELO|nr:hypothetical protein HPB48_009740 [Haemaphysalis longicornis]
MEAEVASNTSRRAAKVCDRGHEAVQHQPVSKYQHSPQDTCYTSCQSFSTLKRLKTYLRNSSVEGRLNGLALMSLYRESVDVSNVIATFTMKARRHVLGSRSEGASVEDHPIAFKARRRVKLLSVLQ